MKIQNTANLREFLLKQMTKAADGKLSSDQCDVVCRLTDLVIKTLALEIRAAEAGAVVDDDKRPMALALTEE